MDVGRDACGQVMCGQVMCGQVMQYCIDEVRREVGWRLRDGSMEDLRRVMEGAKESEASAKASTTF